MRERQLFLVNDPVNAPKKSELSLTDDQTRQAKNPPASIQLRMQTGVI